MAKLGEFQTSQDAVKAERDRSKGGFVKRLPSGKTVLRILPPWSSEGLWFKRVQKYFFAIDGEYYTFISPRVNGGRDPIYAYARKLKNSDDVAQQEKAKDFFPATKYFVNAVVLASPDGVSLKDGVQVFELPMKVKESLVELDTDADAGFADITNLERGFNVIINKNGKGFNTSYTVQPVRQPSNILETAKEQSVDTSGWELFNLDNAAKPASEEELAEFLPRLLPEENTPAPQQSTGMQLPTQGAKSESEADAPATEGASLPTEQPNVENPVENPPF